MIDREMNKTGGRYKSDCHDLNTSRDNELAGLRHTAKEQKRTLLACKKFLEQLQEKGISLSFTERTAASLLLEQIKRFE